MIIAERIALGSAQFGMPYGITNTLGRVPNTEAHSILKQAGILGIDTIDTAVAYGDSESLLGAHGMDDWHVITKLPALPISQENVAGWVSEQIHGSLARLRVKQLYGVLLHRPDQLLQKRGGEILTALRMVQSDGLTRKIGVSVYSPDELSSLMAIHPFEIIQTPCSILDRRFIETGWAEKLKASGTEIHTRSIFLQGLLLSPTAQKRFPKLSPLWRAWRFWLQDQQLSAMHACIRYALNQKAVDKIVVGLDNVTQLLDLQETYWDPISNLPQWPEFDDRILNPSRWDQL